MGLEHMIITISGMPGSGKSTIARMLKGRLGDEYEFFSGGDFRGEIAKRHNITIDELNRIGEKEIWTDKECDDLVVEYGRTRDKMVIDSRLAWHFIPHAVKIYFTVDPEAGAERVFRNQRPDEPRKESVAEVKEMLRARYEKDRQRYLKWYQVDVTDTRNYDLVIDTTTLTPEQVVDRIFSYLSKRKTARIDLRDRNL
jgi:cytidylate kinase